MFGTGRSHFLLSIKTEVDIANKNKYVLLLCQAKQELVESHSAPEVRRRCEYRLIYSRGSSE